MYQDIAKDDQLKIHEASIILLKALKQIEELNCVVIWEDSETKETGRINSNIDWTPYNLKVVWND